MKIALVSPYDFAWPGGVTAHISHLAQQFSRQGHSVKILAPSSKTAASLGMDNFVQLGRPVPVPSGGSVARISLSVWLLPKLRHLLAQERFDIVHLHEPLAPMVPLSVLQMSRTVNIGTFHAYHGSSRFYPYCSRILQHWFKRLHGRIAVSNPARDFARRYFPGDYAVIPNGIDVGHFSTAQAPIPEFADGKLNLLFVGRMEKRKGLRHLLEAYNQLKWEHPDLRLIVVGPGTPDKECLRLLGECNLQDVVFMGGVAYQDLPRFYQTAHIFCAPATGKESFGIVLLEAMAAGKPIVASRIEGYSTIITDGVEGLLVKPKDADALAEALRRLIDTPALQQSLGQAGRSAATQYTWEQVASRVMEYYLAVLDTTAPREAALRPASS